jgi:hypothetical protein
MISSSAILKTRKITAIIAALIGILLFLGSFYHYAVHDYKAFITSYAYSYGWSGPKIWSVYLASALRFMFRLSYVTSFVGLLFLKRWSVYLCLIAWLGQLLPSVIFFWLSGHGIAGHMTSFVSLLVYIGIVAFCWPALKPGRPFLFCSAALIGALLIHTVAFAVLFSNAAASGGH